MTPVIILSYATMTVWRGSTYKRQLNPESPSCPEEQHCVWSRDEVSGADLENYTVAECGDEEGWGGGG
jgi:hypothetical protein